jgi:Putative peptidoglycan binding domain
MAEFSVRGLLSTRRALLIAAIALAAATVAAEVAVAADGGGGGPAASGGGGSVATAPVVRTTLTNTMQEGGSIGYQGSYTVAAPSGTSAPALSQQEQTVAADEQALSADEQAVSDAVAAGRQAVAAARVNVSTGKSTLAADQATEKTACAGAGASSQACTQDKQQVSTDQTQLTQARQQLGSAESSAKTGDDTAQGKVGADRVKLAGDRATLATDRESAVNPGTAYTWLPAAGAVIRQDQRVYAVSGVPVPLLYGSVAAYRAFYVGMSDGGDVAELTRDLIALGYGSGLAQSDHYSAATAAAVDRWQQALGLPMTGEILLGEVVFEPGPIRVTSVTPAVGASVGGGGGSGAGAGGGGGGGGVLTATGITQVVTVDLPVTQEYLVKAGEAVSVVLPDGTSTVRGRVKSVGSVATCPGGGGTGTAIGGNTGSTGGGGGQSPCSSAGSNGGGGSNSSPTVAVTITLHHTPGGAGEDQAPVNVNITSQRASNVLAVPVNALLALAGGGFGVQVVTGHSSHLVGVTTGLYGNTLVQVSGPGITAGTRVEVPSS